LPSSAFGATPDMSYVVTPLTGAGVPKLQATVPATCVPWSWIGAAV
jgi:hypothetical protein